MVLGPLTLAANGFVGKNLAPLNGDFIQFQANNINDVHEMGGGSRQVSASPASSRSGATSGPTSPASTTRRPPGTRWFRT